MLRVGDGSDSACHAEWDVEELRYSAYPAAVNRTAVRTRGDVVEDELVGAFLAVARSQLEYVADDPVIAESDAFDDLSFAYV